MVLDRPKIFLRRLQQEAEVEYRLLLLSMGNRKLPTPDMIELISYKSDVEWFRTTEFRLALINYRNRGFGKLLKKERAKSRRKSK